MNVHQNVLTLWAFLTIYILWSSVAHFVLLFFLVKMTTDTQIECRAEYAVGTIIFIFRWATRGKMRIWKLDDWFSISAWIFFTLIYAMVEYLGKSTVETM